MNHYQARNLFDAQMNTNPINSLDFLVHDLENWMNIAHIFRLADAINCQNLYLSGNSINTLENKKVKILKACRIKNAKYQNIYNVQKFLETYSGKIICLEVTKSSVSIFQHNFSNTPPNILVVVGSEKNGLPDSILNKTHFHIHVPMYGANSSMNVAMALAIASYNMIFSITYRNHAYW